jgi:hypothetical protein
MESAGESAGTMRNGWREVGAGLVISTLLGVTLGAIGPFGSYLNGALPARIAYWVACLWIGWLVFGLGVPLL